MSYNLMLSVCLLKLTKHQLIKSTPERAGSNKASLITQKVHSQKPKLTIFGDSIIPNTGPKISSLLPHLDTSVYSTSGLKIHQATKQIMKIYEDHGIDDTAVLQVGTL